MKLANPISEEERNRISSMIDDLISKAKEASKEYMKLDQDQIDNIVKQMSMAGLEHHMELAKMAVEETGRGIYEDKITKNMFATEYIYHSIKYDKTVGIINENEEEGYEEIAEPIGIIAGITPVTNPTSTTMFKSIIAAKTRNVIIFGFHPSAQKCSVEAAKILRDAAIKAGAPENCILWIEEPSVTATTLLMNHPGINLILATGGSGMVKSAYSSGKPALGVGPGNVPCYIDKTAKLKTSVNDLVLSKSFDNGMICASEQSVIVNEEIKEEFENLIMEYLPVTAEQIREYAVFDEKNQTYYWARLGCSNYAPTFFGTSLPEVIDIKENEDGTITLTVEAVCDMVICDDAVITHELTVKFADDGSFQYLGNKILDDGIKEIPAYQYRIKE